MRKLLLITGIVSALSLSVPIDLSFANTQTKKQVVQGKAKQTSNAVKKNTQNKRVSNKNANRNASKKSRTARKEPRYAKNINKPQEGELLKLEGMVKDLNEQ
ncbi:hypothetical protein IAE16_07960 [Hydrogenobacter sp. T-2]|uniref:hypothetical protein n=1 Tax=Pampinifervens diazotrophicum TaxID=1632018 RepID=UPI002B2601E0|nr:hypothetical protein [Hydrogenobacter sp. T-2]WPM31750.1 hypothetical protein IAE16_07960 [Hydrogenobacter sp. T-2]